MAHEPVRKIFSLQDVDKWKASPAFRDYNSFVKQLNDSIKGVHAEQFKLCSEDSITEPVLVQVKELLQRLSSAADRIAPFDDDKNQRFGNKAYRDWFDEMAAEVHASVSQMPFDAALGCELEAYLRDAFGNRQRIDYGTGHEMNFVIFLMGVTQFIVRNTPNTAPSSGDNSTRATLKALCQQTMAVFAAVYMPLVRQVQLRYRLEPAGSHGVFSLDDFQFLPFLFGSAQLCNHPRIEPKNFPERAVAEEHERDYMFHAAIAFIHKVKSGPFAEHSNQLWNISGVEEWSKVNRGLLKMYNDEVLSKFPIVQHLVFGEHIFRFN